MGSGVNGERSSTKTFVTAPTDRSSWRAVFMCSDSTALRASSTVWNSNMVIVSGLAHQPCDKP